MASKRRLRRRGCSRKVAYPDQTVAVSHVIAARRGWGDAALHVYRCHFGNHWHIGH